MLRARDCKEAMTRYKSVGCDMLKFTHNVWCMLRTRGSEYAAMTHVGSDVRGCANDVWCMLMARDCNEALTRHKGVGSVML